MVKYADLSVVDTLKSKVPTKVPPYPCEIATTEGIKAKTFVEEIFKKPKMIKIKTYRKDKYDRYLADIFIGSKEVFLNQKLLDEKLAAAY